jgi:hypothetical protein
MIEAYIGGHQARPNDEPQEFAGQIGVAVTTVARRNSTHPKRCLCREESSDKLLTGIKHPIWDLGIWGCVNCCAKQEIRRLQAVGDLGDQAVGDHSNDDKINDMQVRVIDQCSDGTDRNQGEHEKGEEDSGEEHDEGEEQHGHGTSKSSHDHDHDHDGDDDGSRELLETTSYQGHHYITRQFKLYPPHVVVRDPLFGGCLNNSDI